MIGKQRITGCLMGIVISGVVALTPARGQDAEYEIGGPLAGRRLPPFPTQHGEAPGKPGVIPGEYGDQTYAPMVELYPGAVEHYRAYWNHYLPTRSFFDRQSQIHNFVAPHIPGAGPEHVREYAAPVYWVGSHAPVADTGRRNAPVPVIAMNARGPRLILNLGELDRGLYTVRLIAAVAAEQLTPFRKPAVVVMQVNDGLDGGVSTYRFRPGFVDEFYSAAELYFHAPERRAYRVELWMDERTEIDLLVHNISVDDVLAGTERRPLKTRVVLAAPHEPRPESAGGAARRERDAWLWNLFPPLNAQGRASQYWNAGYQSIMHGSVTVGIDGQIEKEIEAGPHGAWETMHNLARGGAHLFPAGYDPSVFLVNRKLGLTYSMDDFHNNRPLPDPYPYKDDGLGLVNVDPQDPEKGQLWAPVAVQAERIIRDYPSVIYNGASAWRQRGDSELAHDAALALARYAYQFPAIDSSDYLGHVIRDPSAYGRNYRNRRRETTAMFMDHYMNYLKPIEAYDGLFDYIQGNQELADSIGRFVPWVKTPADVIELIDVYLVQTTAKRILRYRYYTGTDGIAKIATVLNDPDGVNLPVTDQWMDWLFSRAFVYPLPLAGIQDVKISGTCRDGAHYIGSTFYARGGGARETAQTLETYLRTGGNPKYDLTDPTRYPKALAHARWQLATTIAGNDYIRTGSVTGPERATGETIGDALKSVAKPGWQWSADPAFAFIIRHMTGRTDETDAEWQAIEAAAAQVPRAPWLDLRSRVLANWAGVLETGHQHDDHRFRRAATLRVGYGWGHHHHDLLSLGITAHGSPFAAGDGQRPGYSTPSARDAFVNNTPTIDNRNYMAYSWIRDQVDSEGARYMRGAAEPPPGATLYTRQIALIDVDEGEGSQPLDIPDQMVGRELPAAVVTANSYVFDVVRLAGGHTHTYSFHGTVEDEFAWNVADGQAFTAEAIAAEVAEDSLDPRQPLRRFGRSGARLVVGTMPPTLQATWRLSRGDGGGLNAERTYLGRNYRPDAPRRFTRLHLLGMPGGVAMSAPVIGHQRGYEFTKVLAARHDPANALSTAIPALIEPFVGEPFIATAQELEVLDNETDAERAVALEVTTVNGHRDVLVADGRPDRERRIPAAELDVAAAFALYSTDAQGLRQATLAGGTRLAGPLVRLTLEARERTARVVAVDYLKRQVTLDAPWAPEAPGFFIEVGQPDVRQLTGYAVASQAATADGRTRLTFDGGADYYRSEVLATAAATGEVTCALTPAVSTWPGRRRGWAAANEAGTHTWRAEYLGGSRFRLVGETPVSREAFGEAGVLRLWEYGVGDVVRQSNSASLRRLADGVFELTGSSGLSLELHATALERSNDGGQTWTSVAAAGAAPWRTVHLTAAELANGPVLVRVTQ